MDEPKQSIEAISGTDKPATIQSPDTDTISQIHEQIDKAVAKLVKHIERNQFEFFKFAASEIVKNRPKVERRKIYGFILSVSLDWLASGSALQFYALLVVRSLDAGIIKHR